MNSKHVIHEDGTESSVSSYPIRPADIDVDKFFWGAFGCVDSETSARWIIATCKKQNSWKPFSEADVKFVYGNHGYGFTFGRLLDQGYVVKNSVTDMYQVTHEFVCQCFLAAPSAMHVLTT